MKKKRLNIILALTLSLLGFTKSAWSQIYSSEACFYSGAGSSSVAYVVKFESSKVWLKSVSHSTVRENLSKSENFYENEVWRVENSCAEYEYDYQKSTSSKVVYKSKKKVGWGDLVGGGFGYLPRHSHIGYEYVAFSKDKSSFILWREEENDYDGKIQDRIDYTRVPKEDLLPKAANYDFLND